MARITPPPSSGSSGSSFNQPASAVAATGSTYMVGIPNLHGYTGRGSGNSGLHVGEISYVPFPVFSTTVITEAMTRVTTAASAGGTLIAAIYALNSSLQPTTRMGIVSGAGWATDSTGTKKTTGLSISLPAGHYALAQLPLTALPSFLHQQAMPMGLICDGNSALLEQACMQSSGTSHTSLPDPAPTDTISKNENVWFPQVVYLRWTT